ncbi:MAG: hypothetical protein M1840_002307 [Geoglossum simile]|nr:MAG: hypothetical protein M1840_002307 [Geoglossum simile]
MRNFALALALFAVGALGKEHMVMVGGDSLVYNPSCLAAEIGDKVIFQFMKNNHTVTQSTFEKPCVKMAGGKLH